MRGLNALYGLTGRTIEGRGLPPTWSPLSPTPRPDPRFPGREHQWAEITEYRIGLAIMARDWPAAHGTIAWRREQAAGGPRGGSGRARGLLA